MLLDDDSKFVQKKHKIPKFIFAHLFHLLSFVISGSLFVYLNYWLLGAYRDLFQGLFIAIALVLAILTYTIRTGRKNQNGVTFIYNSLFIGIMAMVIAGALLTHLEINPWESGWKDLYKYCFSGIYYIAYTLISEIMLFTFFARNKQKPTS